MGDVLPAKAWEVLPPIADLADPPTLGFGVVAPHSSNARPLESIRVKLGGFSLANGGFYTVDVLAP